MQVRIKPAKARSSFVGLRRRAALASVCSYCDLSKGNAADKRAGVRSDATPCQVLRKSDQKHKGKQ